MNSAVNFANDVLDMAERIQSLERELAHYKYMYEMQRDAADVSAAHVKQNITTLLKAAIDPNSVINVGFAEIQRRREQENQS